jgi:signal peptidase I
MRLIAPARVLDVGLLLAAGLGVLCALWWLIALVLGLQLVSFATGSMAPAYNTGALAVSQAVPLRDVRVGDVVTVDRGPKLLPITHRVVAITPSAGGSAAVVELKGDANATADPSPYRVTALRRVICGLPPLSGVLHVLDTPAGAGTIASIVTLCLLWAFLPRRGTHPTQTDLLVP